MTTPIVACVFFSRAKFQTEANDSPNNGSRKPGEAYGKRTDRCMEVVDAWPIPHCFAALAF